MAKLFIFFLLYTAVCSNLPLGKAEGLSAEESSFAPFPVRPVKDRINVRVDATLQSPVIGALSRKDLVRVIEVKYEWYKIILPGPIKGYIHKKYVAIQEPGKGVVTGQGVNIRTEPRLESLILGSVNRDESVDIRAETGDWYRVNAFPYAKAWVYAPLLERVAAPELKATNVYPYGFVYRRNTR